MNSGMWSSDKTMIFFFVIFVFLLTRPCDRSNQRFIYIHPIDFIGSSLAWLLELVKFFSLLCGLWMSFAACFQNISNNLQQARAPKYVIWLSPCLNIPILNHFQRAPTSLNLLAYHTILMQNVCMLAVSGVCLLRLPSLPVSRPRLPSRTGLHGPKHR